jgi:hypothetical protein
MERSELEVHAPNGEASPAQIRVASLVPEQYEHPKARGAHITYSD